MGPFPPCHTEDRPDSFCRAGGWWATLRLKAKLVRASAFPTDRREGESRAQRNGPHLDVQRQLGRTLSEPERIPQQPSTRQQLSTVRSYEKPRHHPRHAPEA